MISELETVLESTQAQKPFILSASNTSVSGNVPSSSFLDSSDMQLSQQTLLQLIKTHVMEVEKQSFIYTAVFCRPPSRDVSTLLSYCRLRYIVTL